MWLSQINPYLCQDFPDYIRCIDNVFNFQEVNDYLFRFKKWVLSHFLVLTQNMPMSSNIESNV